jgi:hypothetical protein
MHELLVEALMHPWILCILIFMFCPLVFAGVYKWTDEQGRIHYSDRPMSESSQPLELAPEILSRDLPATQLYRRQLQQRMLDVYREERAEKRQAAEKLKQEKKQNRHQCHQARKRYDKFNYSRAIYDRDDSGQRRYLEHKERARYLASLKSEVDRLCVN